MEGSGIVAGVGPIPCDKMIIGEAPGAEEEQQGVPFVGRSGELLNKALEAVGVERSDFFITNVYKLRPPNNRDPEPAELAEHREWLREEFETVKPNTVLVLGKVPRDWLLPDLAGETIENTRDYFWQWDGGILFKVTYHPSYILRKGGEGSAEWSRWLDDIREFVYQ